MTSRELLQERSDIMEQALAKILVFAQEAKKRQRPEILMQVIVETADWAVDRNMWLKTKQLGLELKEG